MKNIYITGIHGFIGETIRGIFEKYGYKVNALPRNVLFEGGMALKEYIEDADVIVNLAGKSIMGRWTARGKEEIMRSRVLATRNLVRAVNALQRKPQVFINASAVGIYKDGSVSDENATTYDSGFLAEVVKGWEKEVAYLEDVRKVILRFGIVLGKNGGVLKQLKPSFRFHLFLIMGSGKQAFPVVHVKDIAGFIRYAIENRDIEGIYNMVIPNSLSYLEFTKALEEHIRIKITIKVPEKVLLMLLGESALVLTRSANVIPFRTLHSGYRMQYPDLKSILSDVLIDD